MLHWGLVRQKKIMKKTVFGCLLLSCFFVGCGSKDSKDKITHLPYLTEENGRWGLIDLEGNVLIEDEFDNMPSVVVKGHFCVTNSDGLKEIYTAEKDFKQIGEEYLQVGRFSNDLAPVAKYNSHISYINTKGEEIFTLTKYKDEPIEYASSFLSNGLAYVKTATSIGVINTSGEFVIPPIYAEITIGKDSDPILVKTTEGKYLYLDKQGKAIISPDCDSAMPFSKGYAIIKKGETQTLINKSGEEVFKSKKGMKLLFNPSEGLIAYSKGETLGFLNMKGEVAIKLPKRIKNVLEFKNGLCIFTEEHNGDTRAGLIDKKGEIVVRAKYEMLMILENSIIYRDNKKYGFLSYSGDIIKKACYDDIIFCGEKCSYAQTDGTWICIDDKGEKIERKNSNLNDVHQIYNASELSELYSEFYTGVDFYPGYLFLIKSDYLDVDTEVKKIMTAVREDYSVNRMLTTYRTTPEDFANIYNKEYTSDDLKGRESMYHNLSIESEYISNANIYAYFDNEVIVEYYEKEWVDNRWGGYYDNVTKYSYNPSAMLYLLTFQLELKGKFYERESEVLNSICKWFEQKGYEKQENLFKKGYERVTVSLSEPSYGKVIVINCLKDTSE